jgi:carbonic anhydrase/acetyltransferase-like protein (isoleucine patch superfamily)
VLLTYKGKTPKIGKNVFLAPGCHIIGDVEIGDDSSIWFNSVIRGDVAKIIIGKCTNIQDGTVIHGARFPNPTAVNIGDNVIIGHNTVIHASTIGNGSLIGMGSLVLNRAVIGEGCLIGAGSIVTEDKVIPPGKLAIGTPARVVQDVPAEQHERFAVVAGIYRDEGLIYSELCDLRNKTEK